MASPNERPPGRRPFEPRFAFRLRLGNLNCEKNERDIGMLAFLHQQRHRGCRPPRDSATAYQWICDEISNQRRDSANAPMREKAVDRLPAPASWEVGWPARNGASNRKKSEEPQPPSVRMMMSLMRGSRKVKYFHVALCARRNLCRFVPFYFSLPDQTDAFLPVESRMFVGDKGRRNGNNAICLTRLRRAATVLVR
jgi:hypothetical protein